MKRFATCLAVALVVAMSVNAQAEELKSGLDEGAFVDAFNVTDVTGPAKGTSLCYRCRYGGRPVVAIFTRNVDENLAKLVKQIDTTVGKNEDQKMAAFVVLLTDDKDAAETNLKKLAAKHKITNTPLTYYSDTEGPSSYKISKDADVNVMMWTGGKVKVNAAFKKDQLNEKSLGKVVKETSKILE